MASVFFRALTALPAHAPLAQRIVCERAIHWIARRGMRARAEFQRELDGQLQTATRRIDTAAARERRVRRAVACAMFEPLISGFGGTGHPEQAG